MSGVGAIEFGIGRVLGRCCSILFRDSLFLTGLTVLFYVATTVFVGLLLLLGLAFVDNPGEVLRQVMQDGETAEGTIGPEARTPFVIVIIAAIPVVLFTYGVFTAFVIERAMQKSLAVAAGIGETFRRSLRAALPLIGAVIVLTILFYIGLTLLIVPGVFVAIFLCLSPAATVVERAGVFGGMSRSMALTKGQRWRVFALLVIFFLVSTIPPYVVLILFAFLGALLGPIGIAITSFIATLVVVVYGAVLGPLYFTVMYHDLRLAKEGWSQENIAAVFD